MHCPPRASFVAGSALQLEKLEETTVSLAQASGPIPAVGNVPRNVLYQIPSSKAPCCAARPQRATYAEALPSAP